MIKCSILSTKPLLNPSPIDSISISAIFLLSFASQCSFHLSNSDNLIKAFKDSDLLLEISAVPYKQAASNNTARGTTCH